MTKGTKIAGVQRAKYPTLILSVWYRSHVLQKLGLQTAVLNFDSLCEVNPSTAYMAYNVSIYGAFPNIPECKNSIT